MKKLKFSNRGSTLVEIIVALAIFGIVTVPLMRAYLVSVQSSKKSGEAAAATYAAQNLVERLAAADMDELLKNSRLLSEDASFCEKTPGSEGEDIYTPYGTVARESPDKTYYLYIPGVSSDMSEFDALATLSADTEDNEVPIGISNEMDAVISMRGYDLVAESDYIAECTPATEEGEEPPPELTIQDLSRSLKISVSRQNRDETANTADYLIKAVMTYENPGAGFLRSYPASALVRGVIDPPFGDAAFSLFLIYDAYYKSGAYTEEILIENDYSDQLDFNVFLVNINEGAAPVGYRAYLSYKSQRFDGAGETQSRVFTNLDPESVSYRAYRGHSSVSLPVSGYLIEQKPKDRRYLVSVALYEKGAGPEGDPVFSLDSQRLY